MNDKVQESEGVLAAEVLRDIENIRTQLSEGVQSKDLSKIEESIQSSNKILDELSSYCQEIVGPDKLINMSLNVFLKDSISVWKKKFWSIDLRGTSECTKEVECSKVKLKRMFENLILNSMEAGSSEVEINVTKKGIIITDDGDGISNQDASEIKEKGTTKGKGRGFGLKMVKSFAATLGWKLVLKNNQNGEGMTVSILFE